MINLIPIYKGRKIVLVRPILVVILTRIRGIGSVLKVMCTGRDGWRMFICFQTYQFTLSILIFIKYLLLFDPLLKIDKIDHTHHWFSDLHTLLIFFLL